jgi:hypothetical protein
MVFTQTCLSTYEEVWEVSFDEEGGIERQNRKDYQRYSEEGRSPYCCSKCRWVLADEQGAPLLEPGDIGRWVRLQEQDPESRSN